MERVKLSAPLTFIVAVRCEVVGLASTTTVTVLFLEPKVGETFSHIALQLIVQLTLDVIVKEVVWLDGPKSSRSLDTSNSYVLWHPFIPRKTMHTIAIILKFFMLYTFFCPFRSGYYSFLIIYTHFYETITPQNYTFHFSCASP